MEKMTYIYTLTEPTTGLVRYIGKADNIESRLTRHISESKKLKTHNHKWINKLLKENITPIVSELDYIPFSEWQFWEKHYISLFKSWGFKLVNGTDGGDGGTTTKGRPCSDEMKKYLSELFKGREGKKGEKNPMYGRKHTEETKQKISEANTGRERSEEEKRKQSERMMGEGNHFYGKKHTDEVKEVIKEKRKLQTFSEEIREKISKANKGKKITEDTRKKISEALKGKRKTKEQIEKSIIARRKNIYIFIDENNQEHSFFSIREAEKFSGTNTKKIKLLANTDKSTTKGYKFKIMKIK